MRILRRNLPLLLAALLHFMPMLRAVLPLQTHGLAPSTWAIVLKLTTGAVGILGFHAISSASNIIPNGATYNLAAGNSFSNRYTHTPYTASDYTLFSGTLPPGLTFRNNRSSADIFGTPTNAGSYSVVMRAWEFYPSGGNYSQATFNFNVAPPPTPPVITNISATPGTSVAPGANVTFTPVIGGTPPFQYRWKFNGTGLFGGTNATLAITSAQSSNAGVYTLLVSNGGGSATTNVTLVVNGAPFITGQPQDMFPAEGTEAAVQVTAGGAATLRYQWFREDTALADQTNATMSLTSVQRTHTGRYFVVVTNNLGRTTSSVAWLRISPSSVTNVTQIFPLSQAWRYNTNGLSLGASWREFDFNDAAWPTGNGVLGKEDPGNPTIYPLIGTPFVSISNGVFFITNYYFRTHFTITNKARVAGLIFSNVIDDGAVFYLNGVEVSRGTNMPGGTITANTLALAASQEGIFTTTNIPTTHLVQGDNVLGVETHQVNNTSVDIVMGLALFGRFITPNTLPIFITNPVSQTVSPGASVTFTAAADGWPVPNYQWFKGSTPISYGTTSSITLTNVSVADSTSLTCVASNLTGSVTSEVAQLTVEAPATLPVIMANPQSAIAPQGTNLTLQVSATGSSLVYRWRFNTNSAVGANSSSHALTSAQPNHSGFYSVIVSNSAGSVTSSHAQVLIVPPPSPADKPTFQPPQSMGGHLNLSFSSAPGYRYWLQTSTNVSSPAWDTISNIAPAFSGTMITIPVPASGEPQSFYRIQVQSP